MCAKNTVRQTLEAPGELFFSLSELKKLVEQENSCVSVVTTKRSISLMPLHLRDLETSVKELLKAKVNRYDVQLEGVILAHKNVKLMVNSTLLSDSRHFHLEYLADIYVFKPKVANMLTGTVNKVTKQYVNILVHGIFNVTVYPSGSREIGNLRIGCQVVVKVTALDYTGRLPFIKASFISPNGEEETEKEGRKLKKMKKKSRGYEEAQTSLIGVSQREEPSSLIGVSQRKEIVSILKNSPLRIAQQSSTELESQDAESSSTESSKVRTAGDPPPTGQDVIDTPKKHKKKKKSKSDEVVLGGKSSNKRKREEEDGTDSISPKKKKKKEKHRDKEIKGSELTMKPPLDNTIQIQADESIFKAASSTPVLGPPPSPKKRKRKNSEKADLVASLMQMKMEEMSGTEPMDTTQNSGGTKDKSKSKKPKIKQEAVESHGSRDDSSSIDADSQASGGKKKKKKKKNKDDSSSKSSTALDELTKSMLSQTLKRLKGEV